MQGDDIWYKEVYQTIKEEKHSGQGLVTFTLGSLVVVRHLETGSAEAALDVKALVGLAAVEDRLVAAHVGGDVVEGLDDAQAELLSLLVLGDGNVFDVASLSESVNAAEETTVSNGGFMMMAGNQVPVFRTYNLRSTTSAPVATTVCSVLAASSTTRM